MRNLRSEETEDSTVEERGIRKKTRGSREEKGGRERRRIKVVS